MILHVPVLFKEVCSYVLPSYKILVDCTLGHGGHSSALLRLAPKAVVFGFDVDQQMMDKAKFRIHTRDVEEDTHDEERIRYIHDNYAHIYSVLGDQKADYILNDLGVNLEHFKNVDRGFSIRGEAPLDMRFDLSKGQTAADILANYTIDQLKNIFEIYADFSAPKALELAKHIVTTRRHSPIITTQDFKLVLNTCGLGDKACTVIFQALRIETNKELDNLKNFLLEFPKVLADEGRCLIITYHSIEDRFVKHAFNELVATGQYRLVTKKPVMPHYTEVAVNRASRSAKLRILEKLG